MAGINHKQRVWHAVEVSDEFKGLLKRAANVRGINLSSYTRRALAAFIAWDLQMPFEDVVSFTAQAQACGEAKFRKGERSKDDGEGFGDWRIRQMG